MTGRDFLIEMCDEKFTEEDLNQEVLAFTLYYYMPKVKGEFDYIDDYQSVLDDNLESLYQVENSWDNYDKLKPILDQGIRNGNKKIPINPITTLPRHKAMDWSYCPTVN